MLILSLDEDQAQMSKVKVMDKKPKLSICTGYLINRTTSINLSVEVGNNGEVFGLNATGQTGHKFWEGVSI